MLSATPYVHITTTKGVDLKTGRLQVICRREGDGDRSDSPDILPLLGGCKGLAADRLLTEDRPSLYPHNNMCEDMEGTEVGYIAGAPRWSTCRACCGTGEASR